MATSNWAVGVGVELVTTSAALAAQIKGKYKDLNVTVKADTGDSAKKINEVTQAGEQLGLTYQEANMIMSKCVEAISAMVEQTYELNDATTEFKKVSDLTGASLDNYVSKLSDMGSQVARTG